MQSLHLEPAETSSEFRRIVVDGIVGCMSSIGLTALSLFSVYLIMFSTPYMTSVFRVIFL